MLRRIETREEVERRKKRNQFLVGGVLIFLLVVSTLGYSLIGSGVENENRVSEFGFDFFRDRGYWNVEIGGSVFGFQYLPSEVANVSVNGSFGFDKYIGEKLYFVDANEGASEVLVNLGNYVLNYQGACIDAENCEGDLPLKNCSSNLIVFEAGDKTSVSQEENCVFIVGDGVKGADAFLYKSLKII